MFLWGRGRPDHRVYTVSTRLPALPFHGSDGARGELWRRPVNPCLKKAYESESPRGLACNAPPQKPRRDSEGPRSPLAARGVQAT